MIENSIDFYITCGDCDLEFEDPGEGNAYLFAPDWEAIEDMLSEAGWLLIEGDNAICPTCRKQYHN